MQAPVLVLNQNTKRETGRKAQLGNIQASKAIADIVRTCLGPKAMLKMVLDAMGGIVLTNDGNAILREIDVSHPAAKSMIELSRAQDEEVGDGTTSVIVLAGEMLSVADPLLERNIHPAVIVRGFAKALDDAVEIAERMAFPIDTTNKDEMIKVIHSCLGTKLMSRYSELMTQLALDAVLTVSREVDGHREIDIKRYAKVEKIPGGELFDSKVISGVMMNKDIVHAKMRRHIQNPRVLLLDCHLEYKKAESQLNVELTSEDDFEQLLKMEEEFIQNACADILRFNPDVVVTEKGLSDLAAHILFKQGVSALRRVRKTDNNRIARATGATIVSRTSEIQESDIGTQCGLFSVRKIGDEYFAFFEECQNPKACSIVLRGPSKDMLNEVERNLHDAMGVARNVVLEPRLLPGGGAVEMAVGQELTRRAEGIEGVEQWAYRAVAQALEVIPRTLAQNCGANVVRVVTELRAKHNSGENSTWGIDGEKGVIADMKELGVWDTFSVKVQTFKTAIEAACMLLKIDEIVSGISKKKEQPAASGPAPDEEEAM
nr:T-complex protein 1 subunit gamma [Seculamonas ecuadoriensis]